jgi:hypothetical protein
VPDGPGPAAEREPERVAAPAPLQASAFVEAFGGVRGLLDSALPATVFVLVRLATGSLATAIWAAVGVGLAVLVLRALRGEPLSQALSGFFGLGLAVLVARATGSGEGFFLPGILTTALTGVAFVGSLVLGRPAVGIALAAVDEGYAGWREHPPLLRACRTATAFWALTFFVRAGVAFWVYQRAGDNDGALLIVINAVKWPLIALAALLTVTLVRRAGHPPVPQEPAAPSSS